MPPVNSRAAAAAVPFAIARVGPAIPIHRTTGGRERSRRAGVLRRAGSTLTEKEERVGRATKATPETIEAVERGLAIGATIATVAKAAAVSPRTIDSWLRAGVVVRP